ncbi:MAG: DUF4864 domain-containing protein [Lacunisphaera sp.]|nr:DUF4864 domain-containing protein [Lacunisphaera sp.]
MTILGVLFFSSQFAQAAEPELRLSPRKIREEVRAVVAAQLEALRAGDFATAYDFAAWGIRRQFDVQLFAVMIRRGYPALLRPGQAELGAVRDDGQGTAQVMVTVTDRQKSLTAYRYWLVNEEAGWRISGVVREVKPPRGDI